MHDYATLIGSAQIKSNAVSAQQFKIADTIWEICNNHRRASEQIDIARRTGVLPAPVYVTYTALGNKIVPRIADDLRWPESAVQTAQKVGQLRRQPAIKRLTYKYPLMAAIAEHPVDADRDQLISEILGGLLTEPQVRDRLRIESGYRRFYTGTKCCTFCGRQIEKKMGNNRDKPMEVKYMGNSVRLYFCNDEFCHRTYFDRLRGTP
jgi:hypothetical protein